MRLHFLSELTLNTFIMDKKRVYTFGNGQAEGKADMRNLLGGKGANLAEMNLIGVPVPPGFTITTEVCSEYYELGKDKVVELLKADVEKAIANIENLMNSKFGDVENPLLVSVRSGARASMPGMMDTILNLGLNDEVVEGLSRKTGRPRFAWDSYRRFVQMYGDVVLGMKPVNKEDIDPFEEIIEKVKEEKGVKLDNELEVEDLKELVKRFKVAVKEQTGQDFPTCAYEQLWGAICAVFRSWMNERAILYRKMEGIPAEWGTAVSVQAMVFGNMGDTSATGVCFSRDAGNGEDLFNGEYLINAQGEDVVAGIRTPQQITKIGSQRWAERAGISEEERVAKYPSMEEAMPEIYKELDALQTKLENHYRDMQDMEFTVQEGKLWFLQTRNGKRTGAAMVKIAMDLLRQGMIDEKTALERCEPNKLDELLHPVFDKKALKEAKVLTRGLPASPGAATGQIVFFADDAAKWAADGKKVVMVRIETSPEDLAGMAVAEGILTARGGMTSHAAVVARGMGKCCVSGAGAINVDYKTRTVEIEGITLKEGDFISLNGTTGEVYKGKVETKAAEVSGDFAALMDLCNKYTKLNVRTNADTPHDAEVARAFGASGIGLCRTEHMFFDAEKIVAMREMILSPDVEGRRKALAKLLPFQKADFKGIFKAMDGCPVNPSPFAFTGNRFEFRAAGSSSNCAAAMIAINAAMANQLNEFRASVEKLMEEGVGKDEAIFRLLKETIIASEPIRFEGDGYSEEWKQEAARRGLTNICHVPEALMHYVDNQSKSVLIGERIFNETELNSRLEVELEKYTMKVQIEGRVLGDLAINHIVPTAVAYQNRLLENLRGMKEIFSAEEYEVLSADRKELIREISHRVTSIKILVREMTEARKVANHLENYKERAFAYEDKVRPYLDQIRDHIDHLEMEVDDEIWPLPKYRELLFTK